MTNKISRTLINVVSVIKSTLQKKIRVRDHCHITGKYSGSAHQDCNKIPVIFHNLRGEIGNKHTYKNKKGKRNRWISM